MISISGERHKPHEPVFKDMPALRQVSESEALVTLLKFELGYGGQVVKVDCTGDRVTVTTCTRVLACTDYMTFSGSKKDMETFCRVVSAWALFLKTNGRPLAGAVADLLGGQNTFIQTGLGPMLMGEGAARAALFMAFDVPEEAYQGLRKAKFEDVIAAVCLNPQDPLSIL